MSERDEIATTNQRHWERMVAEGCGCTVPCLDLDVAQLRRYASGQLDPVPEALLRVYPAGVLADVGDKDVLCLGAGGGQQSAFFGVLGARVTVAELSDGQLAGDRKAAEHYGYEVTTVHADMRDLACLADASFDLVYGTGMCYIPDVRQVYVGVARVLKAGGLYRVDVTNPGTEFVDDTDWDGVGYRITRPYSETMRRRADGAVEFRHHLNDIFNGLLEAGFSIQRVDEYPHSRPDPDARPGSWAHWGSYMAGAVVILARKD